MIRYSQLAGRGERGYNLLTGSSNVWTFAKLESVDSCNGKVFVCKLLGFPAFSCVFRSEEPICFSIFSSVSANDWLYSSVCLWPRRSFRFWMGCGFLSVAFCTCGALQRGPSATSLWGHMVIVLKCGPKRKFEDTWHHVRQHAPRWGYWNDWTWSATYRPNFKPTDELW